MDKLKLSGLLHWRHEREGRVIGAGKVKNQVTDEGLNSGLELLFSSDNLLAWYMGLIDTDGFSTRATSDTYTNMKLGLEGWKEFDSDYYTVVGNKDRQAINFAAAAVGGLMTSEANPSEFQITSSGDGEAVHGIFVCNEIDYDETVGFLWSTILLPASRPVVQDDILYFGYDVNMSR